MDLLERYLSAVKPLLPQKGREDILREFSENILSQMEEEEEKRGRPLTEGEQEDVIKRHGHPVVAAARYGRRQYLIGPELFPFYWLMLRIASAGALIVRSVIALVMVLAGSHPADEVARALVEIPFVLVPVFFWVTGAFAVFELSAPHLRLSGKCAWSPRDLPGPGPRTPAIPRQNSAAEIVFGTLAVLWWQALPVAPFLALGPAAGFLNLAAIWTTLHWPVLLVAVAGVVQSWFNLFYPELTARRTAFRALTHAAALVILCVLLRSGNWVVATSGTAQAAGIASIVNRVLLPCFALGIVIVSGQLVWECVQYFRRSLLRSGLQHLHTLPRV